MEVEKLAEIISRWHGEKTPCPVCLKIAQEIAGCLRVEPVQLEVLGDEEICKSNGCAISAKVGFTCPYQDKRGCSIFGAGKLISQATIAYNEAKGQLYRMKL